MDAQCAGYLNLEVSAHDDYLHVAFYSEENKLICHAAITRELAPSFADAMNEYAKNGTGRFRSEGKLFEMGTATKQ